MLRDPQFDPRLARAHSRLGVTLRRRGDQPGALAEFKKAAELDPKDPQAQYDLGMELKAGGDLAGAIAAFRRAVVRNVRGGCACNLLVAK